MSATPLTSALVLALAGCASISVQGTEVAPGVAGTVKLVAVAPLVNRTAEPAAAAAVRELLVRSLADTREVAIGEVTPDVVIDPERLDRTRAQEIAAKLRVDAIVTGTVYSFGYAPAANGVRSPLVRIDLRLISAKSGDIVWVGTASGRKPLLLTNDAMPLTELADKVVAELTEELLAGLR